ncbi:MAG: c-type heme family protein [Gemmataceae bacterium]
MRRLFWSLSSLCVLLACVLVGAFVPVLGHSADDRSADATAPDREAVQRAHDLVKLLDDMHKGYVVHITATYVKAQERTPAAHVAKKVFAHVEKNGGPKVRLIDATGAPINKANVAESDFEKRAVQELAKGEKYVSEIGRKNDRPVLRAATPVPVVMKQCIACHPGYKQGELLGTLVYEVPIK